jgi:hypothetical protein
MSAPRLNPTAFQALAVGLPGAAVLLSLFIVLPTWNRYTALREEVEKKRQELLQLQNAVLPPEDPVLPAAAAVEAEPADFLRQLTDLARSSACVIEDMSVVAPGEGAVGVVRPVRVRVTVSGHFGRVRALLWRIYRAPRLFAVADLSITTSGETSGELAARPLKAAFVLERYLAPPDHALASRPSGGSATATENSSP